MGAKHGTTSSKSSSSSKCKTQKKTLSEKDRKLKENINKSLKKINAGMGQIMNASISTEDNELHSLYLNQMYDQVIQALKWQYKEFSNIQARNRETMIKPSESTMRVRNALENIFGPLSLQNLFEQSKVILGGASAERQKLHIFYSIGVLKLYYSNQMKRIQQIDPNCGSSQVEMHDLSKSHSSSSSRSSQSDNKDKSQSSSSSNQSQKSGGVQSSTQGSSLRDRAESNCIIDYGCSTPEGIQSQEIQLQKKLSNPKMSLARQVYLLIQQEKSVPIQRMVQHFNSVMIDAFIRPYMNLNSTKQSQSKVGCQIQQVSNGSLVSVLRKKLSKSEADFIVFAVKSLMNIMSDFIAELLQGYLLEQIESKTFGSSQLLYKEIYCGEIAEKLLISKEVRTLLEGALYVLYKETNSEKSLCLDIYDEQLKAFLSDKQKVLLANQKETPKKEQVLDNFMNSLDSDGKETKTGPQFQLSEGPGADNYCDLSFVVKQPSKELSKGQKEGGDIEGDEEEETKKNQSRSESISEEIKKNEQLKSISQFKQQLGPKYCEYFLEIFKLLDACLDEKCIYKRVKQSYKLIVKLTEIFVNSSVNMMSSMKFVQERDSQGPLILIVLKSYLVFSPNRRYDFFKLALLQRFIMEKDRTYVGMLQLLLFEVLRIEEDEGDDDSMNYRISFLSAQPMAPVQQRSEIATGKPYQYFPSDFNESFEFRQEEGSVLIIDDPSRR